MTGWEFERDRWELDGIRSMVGKKLEKTKGVWLMFEMEGNIVLWKTTSR